jgi:hypothetical protein
MAELQQFQLNLNQFLVLTEDVVGKMVRKAALDIFRLIVKGSPVDTGRFRASWVISVGAPSRTVEPEGEYTEQYAMAKTTELTPESVKGFAWVYISNNLPYGPALANGHSGQAADGWIEFAVIKVSNQLNSQGGNSTTEFTEE